MYSTFSDDLTRDYLALEVANNIKKIFSNTKEITSLHKELLEINLSITVYVEESKKRLESLRLDLAHEARSSQKVVEVLSEICEKSTMSTPPTTPIKQSSVKIIENNNNQSNKFTKRQQARTFIAWYKNMIDNDRTNLTLYLSDDAYLEWFGRTIKTRKKVAAFLKFDMQCTRHDFTVIESIDNIQSRREQINRKIYTDSTSPLHSPEVVKTKKESSGKRRLRSNCNSPEWAEGCISTDEPKNTENKRLKGGAGLINGLGKRNNLKRSHSDDNLEMHNKGDCNLKKNIKRKCVTVTPPNKEIGQGDCMPSTSADSDRSHETLNSQLQRLAVDCNGFIEFTRTRNNRSNDAMKWERKCKVQISYSEDPLNVGEYIIWALLYTDESKCRRNLLSAFEEIAKQEGL